MKLFDICAQSRGWSTSFTIEATDSCSAVIKALEVLFGENDRMQPFSLSVRHITT